MKRDIWDVLFWFMLAIAIGFILLKIFGIINTPEWVNYIPIITIIFAAGIAYQKLISFMDMMCRRTDYLKNKFEILETKSTESEKRIFALEKERELIKLLKRKK